MVRALFLTVLVRTPCNSEAGTEECELMLFIVSYLNTLREPCGWIRADGRDGPRNFVVLLYTAPSIPLHQQPYKIGSIIIK